MSLENKINGALKEAMKAKDAASLRAIRAIKSEILLFKTSGSGAELDEKGEIKILQKMVKQRNDSLALYEQENREDLAVKEREEIKVIKQFLPEQLSEAELKKIVDQAIEQLGASGMKDMGKVMGVVSGQVAGKADNKVIADLVKGALSQ